MILFVYLEGDFAHFLHPVHTLFLFRRHHQPSLIRLHAEGRHVVPRAGLGVGRQTEHTHTLCQADHLLLLVPPDPHSPTWTKASTALTQTQILQLKSGNTAAAGGVEGQP